MSSAAYLFPGQGSQSVGMGRDLYEGLDSVKKIFAQADEVLGFSLSRLCFEGPEEELRLTINAQPALLAVSWACLQAARETNLKALPDPIFVAGHSLGEYTALAVAGVLDFPTALFLARQRGKLMYEAGLSRPGGMAAVLGLGEQEVAEICARSGTWIANINCPGQIAISGEKENVSKAVDAIKTKGAKAVPLQVSGAFHTPLLQSAADGMAGVIARITLKDPVIPVVANTSALPLTTGDMVSAELLQQLCHCVQWQRSLEYMLAQGVNTFIEIGPGKVLTGLVRRTSKDAVTKNVGDLASAKALA